MALYREGKAAMAADGTVTGTGTKWQSSLSLIRPGATIMFLSSPIQMAVVNKVVSDTEIKAITTKGAVVASSDYAILLSDSLTVDGLAQDVAETLRYYQSQETVIADAVEFFKTFDFESLQNLANQIKADSEAAEDSATAASASESAAKTSETNAKESENAAKTSEVAAETARDQVQQIINDAGEQSTLVVLAQPGGFKNIGRVSSATELADLHGVDGDNVLLESYYGGWAATTDGQPLGGGEFYYDSAKAGINNGVTTFNGWVRKVKNKTLTTHDAGLIPDDGSNATAKLQALAVALKNKYTLIGYGKHLTNDHIVFDSIKNLTIVDGGGFCISAKELSASWVHYGWTNDELPDAVLYFRYCERLNICRIQVVGARNWFSSYTATQTYEMGDAGIRLYHCPKAKITYCDVSNVFTWGIYSEHGDGVEASHNYVHGGCRQSGINITAYSSNVIMVGNLIEDFALYGIEMENFPNVANPVPTKYARCEGNTFVRCGKGVAIVGNIIRADVLNNVSIECYSGVFTRTEAYSKHVSIKGHVCRDCQYGLEITSSTGIYADEPDISAYNAPNYLYGSPYDAIMKWGADRTKFYVHGWSPLAQAFILGHVTSLAVWINGVQYTAISGVRDDTVTLGTNGSISYSALITLSAAVADDVELYSSIGYILTTGTFAGITKGVYTRQYNSSFQMNDKIFVSDAKIRGIRDAIHTTEAYPDNNTMRQHFTRSIIDDCTNWIRGGGNGIYLEGNIPSKGCSAAITQSSPNLMPSKNAVIMDTVTKSTTDAQHTRYFVTKKNEVCVGFSLHLINPSNAGPANINIKINGVVWFTIPSSAWPGMASTGYYNADFVSLIGASDANYVQIENATSNLGYVAYELVLRFM